MKAETPGFGRGESKRGEPSTRMRAGSVGGGRQRRAAGAGVAWRMIRYWIAATKERDGVSETIGCSGSGVLQGHFCHSSSSHARRSAFAACTTHVWSCLPQQQSRRQTPASIPQPGSAGLLDEANPVGTLAGDVSVEQPQHMEACYRDAGRGRHPHDNRGTAVDKGARVSA